MLPIIVALALLSIAPCQATDKNIEKVAEKITDILRRNESLFDPLFTFDAQTYFNYNWAWNNFSHVKVDSVKDLKVRIKEVKKTGDATDVSCEMYFNPDVRGIVKFSWKHDDGKIHVAVIDPMLLFSKSTPMAFTVDFSVKGEETSSPKIDIKSVKQKTAFTWGSSYKCTDDRQVCHAIERALFEHLLNRQWGTNIFAPLVFQVLKDNV